ncbi:hypothetical protein [Salinispora mooreana]|uniref:hypothetical protein n=1 Tax=Salinispora mooreana TaxID=999545 RepID=UPI0003637603|nr:hypothetical protein [Salinispora mooreana]
MHETSTVARSVTSDTWRLRWDIVNKRCASLGAQTDDERATLMGISRATLNRWRRGIDTTARQERRAAERLGLPRDAMWERAAS